jgi:hypothetical protein
MARRFRVMIPESDPSYVRGNKQKTASQVAEEEFGRFRRRIVELGNGNCRIHRNVGVSKMAPLFTTFRRLIVACLIAGLTAGAFCPCGFAGNELRSRRIAHPTTHICKCVLKTGHCHCGSACQCGQPAPQPPKDPATPGTSSERNQSLGLATSVTPGVVASHVDFHDCFDSNIFSASALTLVAQGTRLNI